MGFGTKSEWRVLINQFKHLVGGWRLDYEYFNKANFNGAYISKSSIEVGKWHHFIGVYKEGKGFKLYMDNIETKGEAIGSVLVTGFNQLVIAERMDHVGFANFNGLIDEVVIVNKALTEDEVAGMFNHFDLSEEEFVM